MIFGGAGGARPTKNHYLKSLLESHYRFAFSTEVMQVDDFMGATRP
jgi:hypothetical protein